MPLFRLVCLLLFLNAPKFGFTQNIEIPDSLWIEFVKHRIIDIEHKAYSLAKKGEVAAYNKYSYTKTLNTASQANLSTLGDQEWIFLYDKTIGGMQMDTTVVIPWSDQLCCGFDLTHLISPHDSAKIGLLSFAENGQYMPNDTFAFTFIDYHVLLSKLDTSDSLFLTEFIKLKQAHNKACGYEKSESSNPPINYQVLDTFNDPYFLWYRIIGLSQNIVCHPRSPDIPFSSNPIYSQFLTFVLNQSE